MGIFAKDGVTYGSIPAPVSRASDQRLAGSPFFPGGTVQATSVYDIPASANLGAPYRGYLITTAAAHIQYRMPFHYNPVDINFSYDINEGALDPTMLSDDNQNVPNLVGGASIGFNLRLVREAPEDLRLGVLKDLAVFEKIVGDVGNGQFYGNPVKVMFSTQNVTPVPGYEQGDSVGLDSGLNFIGYPVAVNIHFTKFNYLMIPTRADIDIQLRQLFIQQGETLQTGAQSATQAQAESANAKAFNAGLGGREYVGK